MIGTEKVSGRAKDGNEERKTTNCNVKKGRKGEEAGKRTKGGSEKRNISVN